ncbi:MAG: adenylosuccinate synthase [Proteobacteria bacterium]|nr:adenylosuccinate synthase [Pseudomonadota bacterium]
MSVVVITGAQWGDEGKGKVVDIYSRFVDQVVRFGGGANAGHTLVVSGRKRVFHLLPSGALRENVDCVLGRGMVIDPEVLVEELAELERAVPLQPSGLLVSERAHLVLPQHLLVDELRERGSGGIGTTKRGIGPAYEDKVGRRGVRVGDLLNPGRFRQKLCDNLKGWQHTIERLGGTQPSIEPMLERYLAYAPRLSSFVGDDSRRVHEAMRAGKHVLLEGAQGTLLDIDSGTYPFVTSSCTTAAGACSGSGLGPTALDHVVGISKAYTTRVGLGPFPTELAGELGERFRQVGEEFGATTGRPRRCGWLDLPALRYAVQLNGMTALALTKLDVLTGLEEIQVCKAHELAGAATEGLPYDGLDELRPLYETLPGWSEPLQECTSFGDLPAAARYYVEYVERSVGCPVWLVSVGPDREQTISRHNPFAA